MTRVVMGLYILPSRCCGCGPKHPLLDETLEGVYVKVLFAISDAGLEDVVGHRILSQLAVLPYWFSLLGSTHDCLCLRLESYQ